MQAPDFSLPDQDGKIHKLSNYVGKWVVLYFYPKDDTPGCTVEACNFRDSLEQLQKLGVVILGVSKDSVKSHKKFAAKYQLNFPLLSDETQEMHTAYNITSRTTYLINPQGEIVKIYEKVNPLIHAKEISKDLESLRS